MMQVEFQITHSFGPDKRFSAIMRHPQMPFWSIMVDAAPGSHYANAAAHQPDEVARLMIEDELKRLPPTVLTASMV